MATARKRKATSQPQDAENAVESSLELASGRTSYRSQMKMAELWRNGTLCDINVVVQNETFGAHRNVLASGSDYMHALLCSDRFKDSADNSITIGEMSAASFRRVLEWLYEGRCEVTEEGLKDLLEVASRLQCVELVDKLEEVFIERLKTRTCLSMWDDAERRHLTKLAKAAKEKALRCYGSLVSKEEFKTVTATRLSSLIGSNSLNMSKEEDVFDSIISWAKTQETLPSDEELGELFEKVRFPLMSREFIKTNVEKEQIFVQNLRGVLSLSRGLRELLQNETTCRTKRRNRKFPQARFFLPSEESSGNESVTLDPEGLFQLFD